VEEDRAVLSVDEGFFLQAVKTFLDLENEGEKFEMLRATDPFLNSGYLAARFKVEVGREIEPSDKRAVDQYVAAVYLVSHHNHELSHIGDIEREFRGTPVLDFIRSAAWSFLTAWTMNYGGLRSHLTVPGSSTLVDPSA
jgi:hypothetical protein